MKYHKKYLKEHHKINYNLYYFPYFIFINFIKSVLFKKPYRAFNGYKPRVMNSFKELNKQKYKEYFYAPIDIFNVSEFLLNSLIDLKKLVEEDGKEFYILITPSYNFSDTYFNQCQEFDTSIKIFLKKKHIKFKTIGSLNHQDFYMSKHDFADQTHLSHCGAVLYTRLIFSDLYDHKNIKSSNYIKVDNKYHGKYKIYNNISFNNNFTKSLEEFKSLIQNNKIIVYGDTIFSKILLLYFQEYNIDIYVNKNNSSISNKLSSNIFITEFGYETQIKLNSINKYSQLEKKLDTYYFKTQLRLIDDIFKDLITNNTTINIYCYTDISYILLTYFKYLSKESIIINTTIVSNLKDSILSLNIGYEQKDYDYFINHLNIKPKQIISLTL